MATPENTQGRVQSADITEVCLCGEADCMHFAFGYPWCRPCGDHHRPPECAVDERGRSLSLCGCPWEVIDPPPHQHLPGCAYAEEDPDDVSAPARVPS